MRFKRERERGRQTDRHTDIQTDRDRETERQRQRQTDRERETEKETETDRHTKTDRLTDKQTETKRQKYGVGGERESILNSSILTSLNCMESPQRWGNGGSGNQTTRKAPPSFGRL